MARAFSFNILQLNIEIELTTNQTIVKDQFEFSTGLYCLVII